MEHPVNLGKVKKIGKTKMQNEKNQKIERKLKRTEKRGKREKSQVRVKMREVAKRITVIQKQKKIKELTIRQSQ